MVGSASQALANPNPSTYLGSGKLAAVASQVHDLAVDTVIVDDEISPGQQRNLEKALGAGVRVADRTALILDIFAQRARTKEGKLQVCTPTVAHACGASSLAAVASSHCQDLCRGLPRGAS